MPSQKVEYVYFEGGENPEGEAPAQEKKSRPGIGDKYGAAADEFNIKDNSKITNEGLVEDRQCTDVLCLGVFIIFVLAMLGVVGYSIKVGNIGEALAPFDTQGNICGYSTGFEKYKYMYFKDISPDVKDLIHSGICVEECPKKKGDQVMAKYYSATTQAYKLTSSYDTYSVLNFCFVHTDSLSATDKLEWMAAKEAILDSMGFLNDLYMSSRAVFWSMGLSFVYCIIFIYLMSYFAEYIAWAIVGLVQIGLFLASGFMFYEFAAIKGEDENTKGKRTGFMIGGIVFALSALIFACLIYCGFRSLKVAIDIIDAAADFLAGTKRIIAVPLLYYVLTMIVVVLWIFANISVASIGTITADTSSSIPFAKDFHHTDAESKKVAGLALFLFFGLLWVYNLFKAKTSFIVMASASTYYFNSNKDREGSAEVMKGFKFVYLYHFGSLAFGSFIIALIQFIRIVVVTVAQKAAEQSGNNAAVQLAVKCAECLLKCIERICDYINKTAYAYMAISGDSFCTSAWNGFLLNVKHGLKFYWANFLANAFILLGKVAIIVLNLGSLYLIMKYVTKDIDEGVHLGAPMIVVGFVTFMTASLFLGLFDEAVIALLHCLCVDTDLNGEPIHGPPTFHDSLSKVQSHDDGKDGYTKVGNDMA